MTTPYTVEDGCGTEIPQLHTRLAVRAQVAGAQPTPLGCWPSGTSRVGACASGPDKRGLRDYSSGGSGSTPSSSTGSSSGTAAGQRKYATRTPIGMIQNSGDLITLIKR